MRRLAPYIKFLLPYSDDGLCLVVLVQLHGLQHRVLFLELHVAKSLADACPFIPHHPNILNLSALCKEFPHVLLVDPSKRHVPHEDAAAADVARARGQVAAQHGGDVVRVAPWNLAQALPNRRIGASRLVLLSLLELVRVEAHRQPGPVDGCGCLSCGIFLGKDNVGVHKLLLRGKLTPAEGFRLADLAALHSKRSEPQRIHLTVGPKECQEGRLCPVVLRLRWNVAYKDCAAVSFFIPVEGGQKKRVMERFQAERASTFGSSRTERAITWAGMFARAYEYDERMYP